MRAAPETVRRASWIAVLVTLAAALVRCSLATDLSGLSGARPDDAGTVDAGADGTLVDGASQGDAQASTDADASVDAGTDADAAPDAGCSSTRGPVMVPAADFCVDSTEVTQKQYFDFLVDKGGDTSGQPAACSGNSTYAVPGAACAFDPTMTPNRPVVCVDWCDAFAFCAWSGKRLCGARKGGGVKSDASADPKESQWYAACSANGTRPYPYGFTYDSKKCNVDRKDGGGVALVGSFPQCIGGYPGTLDMSGNVFEWEDSCTATECALRGGSWDLPAGYADCEVDVFVARLSTGINSGFRCCR